MINEAIQKKEEIFHDHWAREEVDVENIPVDENFVTPTSVENLFILAELGSLRGKKILELGSGLGEACTYFAKQGAVVYATDISSGMLRVARSLAHSHQTKIQATQMDAERLCFPDNFFDYVYGANVLHHINLKKCLLEVNRVLKPGGKAAFWDPLRYNPVINTYRKMASQVRSSDEHPLGKEELKQFQHVFGDVRTNYSWLMTLGVFLRFYLADQVHPNQERYWKKVIKDYPRFSRLYRFLYFWDRILLKLPGIKWLAWNIAVVATKKDSSPTFVYPGRPSVNQKALSIRHLILEDIKQRKQFHQPSKPVSSRLNRIANGVFVFQNPDAHSYCVSLEGQTLFFIPEGVINLFDKGDRSSVTDVVNKHSIGTAGDYDRILTKNKRIVSELVNGLEKALQNPDYYANLVKNPIEINLPVVNNTNEVEFNGVSCILPTYNEQGFIRPVIQKLTAVLDLELQERKIIRDYEIIIIDDGSKDHTLKEIESIAAEYPNVKFISSLTNQGLGASIHSGMLAAKYELVFTTASNNAYDYTQLRDFLAMIKESDLIAGYRLNRQEPWIRKVNRSGWNFLTWVLFGIRYRDMDCAFKLFKSSALSQVNLMSLRRKGSILNTEILVRFKSRHLKVRQMPVHFYPHEISSRVGANPLTILKAISRIISLFSRIFAEKLGWFGFITGTFSRSEHPMEIVSYRRSELIIDDKNMTCPICNAGSDSLKKTKLTTSADLTDMGNYSVYYCTNCRNAFTTPQPEFEKRLLLPDIPISKYSFLQRALLKWFNKIRIKRVREAIGLTKTGAVLDIGGGNCHFASTLIDEGFQVTVVEPNTANKIYADQFPGLQFIGEPFSSNLLDNGELKTESFDGITMWHSLEHFPDGKETLDLIMKLLKPGGCLYVCVPNLNSLQAELTQNFWTYLDIPHHLTHFTLNGLSAILRQTGFNQLNIHWDSPEYDIFGFYQSILNVITSSQNYFYNKTKKGKHEADKGLRHPLWTKIATTTGIVWLPISFLLSIWADGIAKPACVEIHCYKDSMPVLNKASRSQKERDQ